ncbi:MAG: ribonuclease III [Lachnospiraceae bacterium]|nr:ribonuclease III [Lachnospiraceae bacterium]
MIETLYKEFNIADMDADQYPPLDLAYIGDCVYELAIRTNLISQGATSVDKLNKKASNLAKAGTQSKMITNIQDRLTEEEITIFKRGRNAKVNTAAKNASLGDYHRATGFEALIGYLYLKKNYERMYQIIHMGWDSLAGED